MDDGSKKLTAKKAQQHAEGRFLAHWDEFVSHRKEVTLKFEELFEVAHDRREAETRLARVCQQLESKLERYSKQTKELNTRGDNVEDRLMTQSKAVEGCREAIDSVRDKTQRTLQELATALSVMRVEMAEAVDQQSRDVEQRHQAALDTARRGDRAIADELLKKMNELNEKLGNNMVNLEEEVTADIKQAKTQLEATACDVSNLQVDLRDRITQTSEQLMSNLDTQCNKIRDDLNETMARVEVHDSAHSEHVGRQTCLDTRMGKSQDLLAKVETELHHTIGQHRDQLKDQLDEATKSLTTSHARVKGDLDSGLREGLRSVREEFHTEHSTRREALSQEMQSLRDELLASLSNCRDRVQRCSEETRTSISQSNEEHQAMYRGLVVMVEGVQHEAQDGRSESRESVESMTARLTQAFDTSLKEISDDLDATKEDLRETRRNVTNTADQLPGITDATSGLRQRHGEVHEVASKAHAVAEEATAEMTRLRAQSENAAAELRRDLRTELAAGLERRDAAQDRVTREVQDEFQHGLESVRTDLRETTARDCKDILKRLEKAEQVLQENNNHFREETHELARRLSDGIQRLHDQSQAIGRQGEVGVAEVRGAVGDLRRDVEQACKCWISEAADAQDKLLSEAVNDALAEQRAEIEALRTELSEQGVDATTRSEQYTKRVDADLKRELEELTAVVDERISAIAGSTRQLVQEQRLESRQLTARQIEERLQPVMDRLSETIGDCKANRRSEQDLGQRCEKLHKLYNEVSAVQEVVSQQVTSTSREITNLRTEMRAELRAAATTSITIGSDQPAAQRVQSPVSFAKERYSPLAAEKAQLAWRGNHDYTVETPALFSARLGLVDDLEPDLGPSHSSTLASGGVSNSAGSTGRVGLGSSLGGSLGAGLSGGSGVVRSGRFSAGIGATSFAVGLSSGLGGDVRRGSSVERQKLSAGHGADGIDAPAHGGAFSAKPWSSLAGGSLSSPPHSPRTSARTPRSLSLRSGYR